MIRRRSEQGVMRVPLMRPMMPLSQVVLSFLSERSDRDCWTNHGELARRAEEALGFVTGRLAVPVSTGTAAIQVMCQVAFRRGSRVAVPDYTHVGTLQAVVAAGMVPVLFPVNRNTWCLDPLALRRYRSQIDAAIVVSPFGYPVAVKSYDDLASELGIALAYDLAGAWGFFPRTNNPCAYSFHATKNFSIGEGGCVVVSSPKDQDAVRRLINFDTLPDRNVGSPYGGNHKIDEIKAAMILAQLTRRAAIESRIDNKREVLRGYLSELATVGMWRINCLPPGELSNFVPSLCVIRGFENPARLVSRLGAAGIAAKIYYPLLSDMPGLSSVKRAPIEDKHVMRECVALPSDLDDVEFDYVVEHLLSALS